MFAAVLDACVLWPSTLRDFLLSLAAEGLYRPLWSDVLLDEVEYNEVEKLVRRGSERQDAVVRAAFLRAQMVEHFPDALVSGFEPLEGTFGLPDPDDEHVVAAAAMAGAGGIVTLNVRDFPVNLIPGGIGIISPARFAADTVAIDPSCGRRAIENIAARSGRSGLPRLTVDDIAAVLVRTYGLDEAVALLEAR